MIRPHKSDAILALVRAAPGLTTQQLAERVFLSPKRANNLLTVLSRQELVVSVRSKNAAVWSTPEAAESMREAIRAAAKVRKTAAERACRQRAVENDVDDLPQVVIKSYVWAPVREAPGPVSVFHLGAR